MADRNVREVGQAFQQRIGAIESRQRAIGLRAWPGAVRAEKSISTFSPSDPAANEVVLSLTIPAGRWLVFAQGSVGTSAVDALPAQYIMTPYVWDPSSGEALHSTAYDLQTGYLWLPANPGGDVMYQTISLVGDIVADDVVNVGFAIQGTPDRFYVLDHPRLRCLPV